MIDIISRMPRPPRDLWVSVTVFAWIAVAATIDHNAGIWLQRSVGVATWVLLIGLLWGEPRRSRAQVAVVILAATALEYTASPGLGVYTYRLHNVPMYVPPGHGLVYLAALCIGRSVLAERYRKQFIYGVLVVCGAWAFWGLALAPRRDVLGAIMYLFLVRFLLVGRQPLVYAGAFVVTSYLELVGTNLGAWTWAVHGPGGIIPQGNPPSGIPGGYCFLDAAGLRCLRSWNGALRNQAPWPWLRPRSPASTMPCPAWCSPCSRRRAPVPQPTRRDDMANTAEALTNAFIKISLADRANAIPIAVCSQAINTAGIVNGSSCTTNALEQFQCR